MNEQTKSLIRHLIVSLGVLAGFLGIGALTGFLDLLSQNLDNVWAAIATLVGFVGALIGFFKNPERFKKKLDSGK